MRLIASLLILAACALPGLASAQTSADAEARVIVRFKADADSVRAHRLDVRMGSTEAQNIAQTRATGLAMRRGFASGRLHAGRNLDERTQVVMASGIDSAALVRRLAQDSEVELVAVDHVRKHYAVPNDPYYLVGPSGSPAAGQWYLRAPTSDVVSSINAPGAWDITFGSSSIYVAVIDTGVRKDHPDLAGQFVGGYDFVAYSSSSSVALATANDGDRNDSDASDPGDWVSQADITSKALGTSCTSDDIDNSSWHGTHVSGLIAAGTNNGLGMAGVAGGVKIVPVRVLGKCGGYDSDIIAGMKWAAGLVVSGVTTNPTPAKVLNLSLGGDGSCAATDSTGKLYRDAITQITATGATIVIAAGNGEGLAVGLPANCPGVIAVAALRHAGTKVGFSNIGPEVGISAPGGNCVNIDAAGNATGPCLYPILSASNSGTTTPVAASNYYDSGFGTSYSTPLVTGTVALMYSVKPTLTSTEVLRLLQSTARPFVTSGSTAGVAQCRAPTSTVQDECYCTTGTCGAGMLDAAAAVAAVQATNTGTVAISVSPSSGATAGQTLTLTASATLGTGRSVASWAWTLVDGGGAVTGFASGASAATATLSPTAAGVITVKATATDDLGLTYSMNSTITVAAAASSGGGSSGSSSATSSGGGGGGGAFSPLWVLGLMLASWLLRKQQRPA